MAILASYFERKNEDICQVMINVPHEVLFDTNMSADEAAVFARKMAALGYYTQNNISISYCAEITGMTEEEFMIFLGQNKVDIYSFDSDEELMRDIQNA